VVGISLGGNALLRFLGEDGNHANFVTAAAAISAPLDLAAGGQALSGGFNMLYTRLFLQTLKRKSLAKLAQFPGLFDRAAMLASRDLHAFDNIVTAPLHGFRDTEDYWARAASKPILGEITVPTLVLNARNDPFLPAHHLPTQADVGPHVLLEQPENGGHVGFMTPRDDLLRHLPLLPGAGHIDWLPARVLRFFDSRI
jgi:predicted alpha/beta-fold hydrolase